MSEQLPTQKGGNGWDSSRATRALDRFTHLTEIALGNFLLYTLVTGWSSFQPWMHVSAVVVTPLLLLIMGLHYHALYEWAREAWERRQAPAQT